MAVDDANAIDNSPTPQPKKGKQNYMPIFMQAWEEAKVHPSNSAWSKFWFSPKAIVLLPIFLLNQLWFGTWWRTNKPLKQVMDNVHHVHVDAFVPTLWSLSMGVVKGRDGSLMLHNFVPAQAHTIEEIMRMGPVKVLFCGSCTHDSFVDDWKLAFPEAKLIGDRDDAKHLEESFDMNGGYWQDPKVAKELEEVYGIQFVKEPNFYYPAMSDKADQVGVITTSSTKKTVLIAPHMFTKKESIFSYFVSWWIGYQGEPFTPNWQFAYVQDKIGARASFKKTLLKFKPSAILAWHSNPWVGTSEVDRLLKRL